MSRHSPKGVPVRTIEDIVHVAEEAGDGRQQAMQFVVRTFPTVDEAFRAEVTERLVVLAERVARTGLDCRVEDEDGIVPADIVVAVVDGVRDRYPSAQAQCRGTLGRPPGDSDEVWYVFRDSPDVSPQPTRHDDGGSPRRNSRRSSG